MFMDESKFHKKFFKNKLTKIEILQLKMGGLQVKIGILHKSPFSTTERQIQTHIDKKNKGTWWSF